MARAVKEVEEKKNQEKRKSGKHKKDLP